MIWVKFLFNLAISRMGRWAALSSCLCKPSSKALCEWKLLVEQNSLQARNFLSEWALLVVHKYLQATFWGIAAISGSVGVSKVDESHRFWVEVWEKTLNLPGQKNQNIMFLCFWLMWFLKYCRATRRTRLILFVLLVPCPRFVEIHSLLYSGLSCGLMCSYQPNLRGEIFWYCSCPSLYYETIRAMAFSVNLSYGLRFRTTKVMNWCTACLFTVVF